ncbi:MAG TPA: hypothetical protein VN645_11085 [Steroidobacteraceae bacterium]|nr:hypothetical protein [Steroidobacteraceae bacterium]
MRPLAVLLGVVMGSGVALFGGLVMTLLVFLLLPEFHDRLAGEFAPLLQAVAWAALLTGAAAAAFLGEIRVRKWRRAAQLAMLIVLLGVGWRYWPS